MRYATDEQITQNLTDLLHRIAPGFTLMHWRGDTNHYEVEVTVCAKEGLNRLMFRAIAFPTLCVAGQFQYIGVATDCHHEIGLDRRVRMLMRVHPDAHIQFIDNEEEGDDFLFGYVAYDDQFRPLAWAPLAWDDDGDARPDDMAQITHTIPEEIQSEMEYFAREIVVRS